METGSLGQGLVNRTLHMLLYSGKLSREKTFAVFVAIRESFLCEIWGCGILWCTKSKQSTKFFFDKIVFFTNSRESFLPQKFPTIRYSTDTQPNKVEKVRERGARMRLTYQHTLVCRIVRLRTLVLQSGHLHTSNTQWRRGTALR